MALVGQAMTNKVLFGPRLRLYEGVAMANIAEKHDDGLRILEEVVKNHKDLVEGHNFLFDAYIKFGFPHLAVQHVRARLKTLPSHAQSLYQLAQYEILQGNFKTAVGHLQNTLKQQSDYIYPRLLLGILSYKHNKSSDSAERNLTEIIERYKDVATDLERRYAYAHLASIAYLDGRFEKALELAESALRISPYFVPVLNLKASTLLKLGKLEEALEVAKKASSVEADNSEAVKLLAICFRIRGESARAQEVLDDFQERHRQKFDVAMALVSLLVIENRYEEAEANLRVNLAGVEGLSLVDEYKDPLTTIEIPTNMQEQLSQLEAVIKKLRCASCYAAKGLIYYLNDNRKLALKEFTRAIDEDPDYLPAVSLLVDYYNRYGNLNAAKDLLDKYSRNYAAFPMLSLLMVENLIARKAPGDLSSTVQDLFDSQTLPLCRVALARRRLSILLDKSLPDNDGAFYRCASAPEFYRPIIRFLDREGK